MPRKHLKFKAVLFDMDGIVIDSERYWIKIEKEFAKTYGIAYNEDYHRKIMALSPWELAKRLQREFKVKKPIKQIIAERNKLALPIYQQKTHLLPGFLPLIKKIKKAEFRTALVSSSPRLWIRPIWRRFKLEKLFDEIISAEALPDRRGKPHPAIYLLAAKKLGVRPKECLVFEDSVNGVKAAKAAGMFCVAVPDRRWIKDRRGIREADLIVASLRNKKLHNLSGENYKFKITNHK